MDFSSNRNSQPQSVAPATHAAPSVAVNRHNNKDGRSWMSWVPAVFVGAVIILLIALVVFLGFGGSADSQSKFVDKGKLQAVFLNTGQVYFGNIKELNGKYLVLDNIYYLQTSNSGTTSQNSNTSVSLVKLGCELHAPYDQMVINNTQVTFWENLQDNGQVAKAVKTFQQQNPNGQKCSDQSAAPTSTTNNVQGSTNTTPSSTTKKP